MHKKHKRKVNVSSILFKKKKLPSKRGTIYTLIVKVLSEIYQQVRSKNQSREKKSCIYVELPT